MTFSHLLKNRISILTKDEFELTWIGFSASER